MMVRSVGAAYLQKMLWQGEDGREKKFKRAARALPAIWGKSRGTLQVRDVLAVDQRPRRSRLCALLQ